MFRALLIAVLMLLVSLPNGLCCCHVFEDVHADVDSHESPTDDADDHDHDCPNCELKPVLACDASQVAVERDEASVSTLERMSLIPTDVFAVQSSHNSFRLRTAVPLSLLHCALRI